MSLELYCRKRVVVLGTGASAFEAARAMAHNRVGAVLVGSRARPVGIVTDRDLTLRCIGRGLDPRSVELGEVMTPEPLSVDVTESVRRAVAVMQRHRVRRLVVLARGRLVGLVSLDDLVTSGDVELDQVRDVLGAQVEELASSSVDLPAHEHPRHRRREARRRESMRRFLDRLMALTGLYDAHQALAAFEVVASGIAQRLTPGEAEDFAAQLPRDFRGYLAGRAGGPDRGVSRRSIETALALRLDIDAPRAAELASAMGRAISELVSPGEVRDMRGQLPRSMRGLLSPRSADARSGPGGTERA